MRHTPIRHLTLAAMIAAAGLATPALAQDAKPKVSSSTTIMRSDGDRAYEIKIEDGQITTFKLNGKDVGEDQYKLNKEDGFIVLKDGDAEPIIIDIPHFNTQEFPGGFAAVPSAPRARASVRAIDPAERIEWFDAPEAPEAPAAFARVTEKPPKVMIGIMLESVSDELREELDLGEGEGVYVTETLQGLPAEKAGVEPGDVIIEVDGKRIKERNVLLEVLKKHEPGDDVTVIVLRDGNKKKLKLELAPYSADRLGSPRALTLRSGEPGRFNIRINDDDDLDFEDLMDLEEFEPFGEFDLDFDMEGLPPEAQKELKEALEEARKQAEEARVRAFTLRRDAHGQRELQELRFHEQDDDAQNRARIYLDRERSRQERAADQLDRASRLQTEEMRRLEDRLAKLRELGENDRLFRTGPEGRAFIIQRDDRSNQAVDEIEDMRRERDDLNKNIYSMIRDLRDAHTDQDREQIIQKLEETSKKASSLHYNYEPQRRFRDDVLSGTTSDNPKIEVKGLLADRERLATRNHELERRVEDLERRLEELMSRIERTERSKKD